RSPAAAPCPLNAVPRQASRVSCSQPQQRRSGSPPAPAEEQLSPSTRYGSGLAARETGLNSRSRISSSDMTDAGEGRQAYWRILSTLRRCHRHAAPANAAKDPLCTLTAYT
uniref:Uncharacterized protein n=1 Tax=Macrostomum lignano TaxID=282301 RepID=A0A1I8ISK9_9PLAT